MGRTWKRREIERRLKKLGWELKPRWRITDGSITFWFPNLEEAENGARWLENLGGVVHGRATVDQDPKVEDRDISFLFSTALGAVRALTYADGLGRLEELMSHLKMAIARLKREAE